MLTKIRTAFRAARRGFTLLEVITTIAIIAILGAMTYPTIRGQLREGEAKAIVAELENLQTAVNTYKSDVGRYPHNLDYLALLPPDSTAAQMKDGCGNALTSPESANYRGPYINRPLTDTSTLYVLYTGDTVVTTFPAALSTGNLELQIKGVDSAVSMIVDQAIDGVSNNAAGMLHWSNTGQSTTITYYIPVRPFSC